VRRLLTLTLLCALALLAAGCGSSDDEARDVLRQTFADAKPVKSGRIDLALKVDAQGLQGLQGPFELSLKGPFQSQGDGAVPKFDLDLGISTNGARLRTGAVSDGESGWLKLEDRAYTLSQELFGRLEAGRKQAAEGGQNRQGLDLKDLGVDPTRWLRDPQTAGEEELAGVQTTHVRGEIDVSRLLEDVGRLLEKAEGLGVAQAGQVPQQLTDEQREKIAKSVQEATVDVWSGRDDRRLRRMVVEVRFDVPEDVRGDGPEQRGTVRLDLRMADLDREQAISRPANARPLSELQAGLAELARVAGAQAQQGGQAAPQGEAAPAPQGEAAPAPQGGSAYERCLAESGGDLRAQQECAGLLGQ
jgi:hypothetical protein